MMHLHEYFRYDTGLPHPDLWPTWTRKVTTSSWGPWSVVLGAPCEDWVLFCDGETVPWGTTVKLDPRKPFVVKHDRREVPLLFASKKRRFADGMPKRLTKEAFGKGVGARQMALTDYGNILDIDGELYHWTPYTDICDTIASVVDVWDAVSAGLDKFDVPKGLITNFHIADECVTLTIAGGYMLYGELHPTPRPQPKERTMTTTPAAYPAEQIKFFRPEGDDAVKSPSHYTYIKDTLGVEVVDILTAAFQNDPLKWNAGKYLFRAEHKGKEAEDLRKAKQYIDFRLAQLENGGRIK